MDDDERLGPKITLLDHGYVRLVDALGGDEAVVRAARMSTGKGFLGWGPRCSKCGLGMVNVFGGEISPSDYERGEQRGCDHDAAVPGDEKLLRFLWTNQHSTPFEVGGDLVVEVKAPIFVLREFMRHRTWSYNEMSGRYVPLPAEDYVPSIERLMQVNAATSNKQAQGVAGALTEAEAAAWREELVALYKVTQGVYEHGIKLGVAKELARLPVPVARYSVMRAKANLFNVLKFLKLRCDGAAQWEMRQVANAIASIVETRWPRTYALARESWRLP